MNLFMVIRREGFALLDLQKRQGYVKLIVFPPLHRP